MPLRVGASIPLLSGTPATSRNDPKPKSGLNESGRAGECQAWIEMAPATNGAEFVRYKDRASASNSRGRYKANRGRAWERNIRTSQLVANNEVDRLGKRVPEPNAERNGIARDCR
jgi:hypothetical protein